MHITDDLDMPTRDSRGPVTGHGQPGILPPHHNRTLTPRPHTAFTDPPSPLHDTALNNAPLNGTTRNSIGYSTTRHVTPGHSTSGHGTSGHSTARRGTSGSGTSGHSTARRGTSGSGTSGHSTTRRGTSGSGTSGQSTVPQRAASDASAALRRLTGSLDRPAKLRPQTDARDQQPGDAHEHAHDTRPLVQNLQL
jgi:hypothetical protein